MGNMSASSGETRCSLPFGSCINAGCASSCMKVAQTECRTIESIIDEQLRAYIHEHLHKELDARIGVALANQLENGLDKMIDIALVAEPLPVAEPTQAQPGEGSTVVPTNSPVSMLISRRITAHSRQQLFVQPATTAQPRPARTATISPLLPTARPATTTRRGRVVCR